MNGHQGYLVVIIIIVLIDPCKQRYFLQECAQLFVLGLFSPGTCFIIIHKLLDGVQQFLHVLISAQSFHGTICIKLSEQAGTFGNSIGCFIGVMGIYLYFETLDQIYKITNGIGCPARHYLIGLLEGIPKGNIGFIGSHNQFINCCISNAPFGQVNNALERFLIIMIDRKPHVCQQILNFLALIKRKPAHNLVFNIELTKGFLHCSRLAVCSI